MNGTDIQLISDKEYTLTLNGAEIATIYPMILKLPYDVIKPTVVKIDDQLNSQSQPIVKSD